MSITLKPRRVDPSIAAALAAYAGPVTVARARPMAAALSASDRLRNGAPYAGAWLGERGAARRARRARRAAAVANAAAAAVDRA